MHHFKRILFINEQNTQAIATPRLATLLARNNKAQLTLCNVSRELPRTLPELASAFRQLHEKQLKSQFEKLDMNGIDVKTKLLSGIPFIEIIREVQRGGHDLVIKSAEGSGGFTSRIFGETDMRLMRKCPCPVWIVKPSKLEHYARIVAAIDPDPEVPENAKLNEHILTLATSLALQEKSELHIVHAWHLLGEDLLRSNRTLLDSTEVDAIATSLKNEHKQWLDQTLENHDFEGIDPQIHLRNGDPGAVIPDFVKTNQVDLVVMGTVARTGIEGFFIGNTAEKILWNVDCSVLTVKPESFKSPVKV